jgi:hypothetical protein
VTELHLQGFVKRQMLTTVFYLSMLICTYVEMFQAGKMQAFWFYAALASLLVNLFVFTPVMMLLGFRY